MDNCSPASVCERQSLLVPAEKTQRWLTLHDLLLPTVEFTRVRVEFVMELPSVKVLLRGIYDS